MDVLFCLVAGKYSALRPNLLADPNLWDRLITWVYNHVIRPAKVDCTGLYLRAKWLCLVVAELKKEWMCCCPALVFFLVGRVFVLQGCSQNVPPLVAANGRCACLCINQGAVNLPFNRWGSRASNYFCIVNAQTRSEWRGGDRMQPAAQTRQNLLPLFCWFFFVGFGLYLTRECVIH